MVKNYWFEKRGVLKYKVLNWKGYFFLGTVAILFFGFGYLSNISVEKNLSSALAMGAFLCGLSGFVVIFLKTAPEDWRN